jgi:hypothetical protein
LENKLMDFSNRVGEELFRLLARRASEELSERSDFDRETAMHGAALIVLAEVLRAPAEKAQNIDPIIDLTSRWLRTLLKPVTDKDKTEHP